MLMKDGRATIKRPALADTRRPLYQPALWMVGNLLVVILIVLDLTVFDGGRIMNGAFAGRDFINVWTAGKLILSGQADVIYDLGRYHAAQQSFFGPIGPHNYSYLPATLILTVPFALLPYPLALIIWLITTGALFLWAAKPWWTSASQLPLTLLLALPAATMNIWAGHYGFLFGGLLLCGWRALEANRPVLAGVLFGLLIIKPHLAILVPVVLLLRRAWTPIASAAAAVFALIGTSILLFGLDPWREYLFVTSATQATMIDGRGQLYGLMATSPASAIFLIGAGGVAAWIGQVLFGAFGFCLVVHAAIRGATLRDLALLASPATFLILPYAFNYDLVVPCFAAACALVDPRLRPSDERLAMLGFCAAQLGMVLALIGAPLMPLFLAGLSWTRYRLAVCETGSSPDASRRPSSLNRSALSLMKPAASRWS
ncbi:hypothetical protein GGR88_002512 [Sphingomonas jejuensis]|uniref:DUF2029 domain-containing protein n=1 Tax=Sphingomonas jejuensis TaxID=904715 RepID=A0ABX0XNP2_9SPHN|nr:glycosyltransferase family 87 protein [Sphingomonas jejuensis]NJC34998.1 hypothetical protein [Sphingomonas jejuensis]